ncbi:hypothetical protein T265_14983 [Opisthorchis viverrini]|uniref:Translation machinery-associated protein 16 n=1 Tax=Opisthorchis viverrini TaxID=6198 RepID=A0A075A3D2_OPIVI|nr:hypothetical protein T265_14983 [Opisthorchis viverrini]KER21914.1 hypothetical protein T265_14983 [Opisthorchis viverrini]
MKVLHPQSRKAGYARRHLHHELRVAKRQKQQVRKNKLLESKLQWFRDNFPEGRTHLTHEEQASLIERYLQRTVTVTEHSSVKSDMRSAYLQQQNEEYSACGLEVPDLTSKANVEHLLAWNDEPSRIPTIKMKTVKRLKKNTECNTTV